MLTANIFALMGLRQLYFLIGGLLERLVYLSYGLAFLLGFIGVKLILHALHENELPFINGGEPVPWAPEIPIWLSLAVIVGTLVVTTVLSLSEDDVGPGPRQGHRPRATGERLTELRTTPRSATRLRDADSAAIRRDGASESRRTR